MRKRKLPPELELLPDLPTLMQRVQLAAGHGYRYYVAGQITQEKWEAFALKMDGRYEITISSSARSKRRRAGEAVCLLYGCRPWKPEDKCTWILLATEGLGRIHDGREKLSELTKQRITFLNNYELVHDGKTWTWKMTRERERAWRDNIIRIAKFGPERRRIAHDEHGAYDVDIENLMKHLYFEPGFRLIRRQVGRLVAIARGAWRRYRPASGPQIRKRAYLHYVKWMPNKRGNDVK